MKKGSKHSEEAKRKIKENHAGYWANKCHTKETKKKMSESRMGKIPWNKGKKGLQVSWCKGTKGIMKPNSGSFKKGQPSAFKGKQHSEKAKKKMKKTQFKKGVVPPTAFKKGHTPWSKGKKFMSDEFYKKLSRLGLKKQVEMKGPTSIEKKVYDELKARGLLFETQKFINEKYLVDAYIPSLNLIIEADGDYWHGLKENMERDERKNIYFAKHGFNLLRLTETEINNNKFKKKLDRRLN